ncbi:MAG: bifunctional phosphopantothenoylcysteine decarboxylase/phosphopantothenate--cysteine ligase CoaBC [Desulfurococcales archaeon]|nr:bifunctional phosphopantothenoylcysteine decarboxylase/phosphopantothenate--cysteine ligase CoaBC [Desulfurococcales archaeon]
MHPTDDIRGEVNNYLEGKCIILGVTGSIAAYRSLDTARWLIRRGARVVPVLTSEAAKLVTPTMFHWATGEEALVEFTGETEHITLARMCDGMLVAPATLSTMAKIAYGIVDNPVALTAVSLLGYGKPLIIAPAMHSNMAKTSQYREAEARLARLGALVMPPVWSDYAAKYPDPGLLARVTAAHIARGRDAAGLRMLVTAGPTREWIDRVRYISNPSSGMMGVEVAAEAWARGAQVDLVHGPMRVEPPHFTRNHRVESTRDMAMAVERLTREVEYHALIAAAAPSDFTPASRYEGKYRSGRSLTLSLEPTPKVIGSLARRPKVLVAFAAEVVDSLDELEERAMEKQDSTGADIMVANIVGRAGTGFASSIDEVVVLGRGGERIYRGSIHKEILARMIVDLVTGRRPASPP